MLDFIRNSAQSLGVKVAFGLIILVFVFWGVGNMQNTNASSVVASVNDDFITAMDFERSYRQAYESVRSQNPQLTQSEINSMQLPNQVLEQLVLESLLLQEAKRLNLAVTPLELRSIIEKIPAFHNAQGKFDPQIYTRLATAQFPSVGAFEKNLTNQVLAEKLRSELTATAVTLPTEIRAFYDYTFEKRDVEYIFFAADAAQVADPTEDSIKAAYESDRALYTLPAKSNVSYVRIHARDLGKPESITDDAIKAYYDTNIANFTTEARAKVRHILLRLTAESAEADVQKAQNTMAEIQKQLNENMDFAELAIKYSEDDGTAPNGGDLDWIGIGETVPPFNDAVFSMQAGQISEPVRTDFGLHLIKVEEIEAATVKPLAEVSEEIRINIAEEAGLAKIQEVVDTLIEANILGNDLAEAAKAQGLSLAETGLKNSAELESLLKITPQAAADIIEKGQGVPLDSSLQTTDNAYVIARIKEKVPASVRAYDDVKADIAQKLKSKAAMETALKNAGETSKTLKNTAPDGLSIESIPLINRGGPVGIFGEKRDMSVALFNAAKGEWLPGVYTVTVDGKEGAALVRVSNVIQAEDNDWKTMEQILENVLTNQRRDRMFQLFMLALSSKAQVEILNEAYFDTVPQ